LPHLKSNGSEEEANTGKIGRAIPKMIRKKSGGQNGWQLQGIFKVAEEGGAKHICPRMAQSTTTREQIGHDKKGEKGEQGDPTGKI